VKKSVTCGMIWPIGRATREDPLRQYASNLRRRQCAGVYPQKLLGRNLTKVECGHWQYRRFHNTNRVHNQLTRSQSVTMLYYAVWIRLINDIGVAKRGCGKSFERGGSGYTKFETSPARGGTRLKWAVWRFEEFFGLRD
jgi:hypothetical protein